MQSNNPIFNNSDGFKSAGQVGGTTYSDPSTWGTGSDAQYTAGYAPAPTQGRMTIDSVVQSMGASLAVVILTAMATWVWAGDITEANASKIYGVLMIGTGGAFVLSLVNSFKRVISPALVLAFAAFEGVALGAISKFFEIQYPGIVVQAVLGTFAAFAGTLAAYKFLNIQVSGKFKMFVTAAMFGMVGLGLLEMVLSMFNTGMGLYGNTGIGLLFAVAGLVLGVFMLIMDFDMVENGIANGLDKRESWRAAFAMTVSLVWIYTNLLRILAILQND